MRRLLPLLLLPLAACSNSGPNSDVATTQITACYKLHGAPAAGVSVTNTSNKAAAFFVTVRFTSPDGSLDYGTGTNTLGTIEPHQHSGTRVVAGGSVRGKVACKVEDVTDL